MREEYTTTIKRERTPSHSEEVLEELRACIEEGYIDFSGTSMRSFIPYIIGKNLGCDRVDLCVTLAARNVAGMAGRLDRRHPDGRRSYLLNKADMEYLSEPMRANGMTPLHFDHVDLLNSFACDDIVQKQNMGAAFLSYPSKEWYYVSTEYPHPDRFTDMVGPYMLNNRGVLLADRTDLASFTLRV